MTVATAVRQFGPAYVARFGAAMPAGHRRAVEDLSACRTAAMGGHVTPCDACGVEHFVYHACRHRPCPPCHGVSTRAWTAARERELLPVPYVHVVFTLPAELRTIVRSHQRVLLGALRQPAAEAPQALAADRHYLGGTIGMLAVLHTWTRTLEYHPQVHCLVPGEALAPDGTWRKARGTYLAPGRALSVGFRARYVHRAAITDARIVRVDATTVTFRYRDATARGWRTMTLCGDEFLRRFLPHVLPRGFHKVRYYGFWRPNAAAVRAELQQRLAPASVPARRAERHDAHPPIVVAPRCAQCGQGHLYRTRRLLRASHALARMDPP